MNIKLAYGKNGLALEVPDERVKVVEPLHVPGLRDERQAVSKALENPIESRPLRELARANDLICITFSDITRATPNDRLIPWLLDHLSHVPRENIVLVNQLGTHRPNTKAELEQLLGSDVVKNYRVLNHEPENLAELVQVGTTRDGSPALLNRHVVEANLRIVTGFIEPHFFAGFSGGPKGIMPGTAGLQTVLSNHRAANIGDPNATFGITEGNPLWEELREIALRVGKSFLLNVALNNKREITGVFAGDLIRAHKEGCEFVRHSAMQRVPAPFDIVVTTNSGYPLDLNLYQAVKGLSAGARILKPGGTLILASECLEGVPAGTPLDRLLRANPDPARLLQKLTATHHTEPEQWQAQILAQVQLKHEVLIHSSIPSETLAEFNLASCPDISAEVQKRLQALGTNARVGVLPYGPVTIPYVGT